MAFLFMCHCRFSVIDTVRQRRCDKTTTTSIRNGLNVALVFVAFDLLLTYRTTCIKIIIFIKQTNKRVQTNKHYYNHQNNLIFKMIYNSWDPKNYFVLHTDAILEIIHNYIQNNGDEFKGSQKRTYRGDSKIDLWQSSWGRLLSHASISDPHSWVAKKFRRRFRIPYSVFKNVLVPMCEQKNI